MAKASLVIMAAGIGSRFGGGIKQLEPVGPSGEIIMDYSIYDALEAGFDKVVFVIRKSLEEDFKRIIGERIEKITEVAYAYQEVSDIPEPYGALSEKRSKPWGTGQAILCCKDVVKEPFLVINADDYYGKQAYVEAYQYLMQRRVESDRLQIGMVGFVLRNTLSDFGSVTRGICSVNENRMLVSIEETKGIEKNGIDAVRRTSEGEKKIDGGVPASMNMWAFGTELFPVLEKGFREFLEGIKNDSDGKEYLLPTIVGELLEQKKADVHVLETNDKWFGVTYKEDKPFVVEAVQKLVEAGVYPNPLFK